MKFSLIFEWDANKAAANLRKHGVSFEDASTAIGDTLSITIFDPIHSNLEEARFVTMGLTVKGELVAVSHCERGDRIRIISARKTNKLERKKYEEGIQ